MKITLCTVLCWAVLVGCAPLEPPRSGVNHPATPAAKPAQDGEASAVLAVDETNLPQTPAEMRRESMRPADDRMDRMPKGAPENE